MDCDKLKKKIKVVPFKILGKKFFYEVYHNILIREGGSKNFNCDKWGGGGVFEKLSQHCDKLKTALPLIFSYKKIKKRKFRTL